MLHDNSGATAYSNDSNAHSKVTMIRRRSNHLKFLRKIGTAESSMVSSNKCLTYDASYEYSCCSTIVVLPNGCDMLMVSLQTRNYLHVRPQCPPRQGSPERPVLGMASNNQNVDIMPSKANRNIEHTMVILQRSDKREGQQPCQ